MYSFDEIRKIFARCKDYIELEIACDAVLFLIQEGVLSEQLERYSRVQAHLRFRQLKV